MAVEMSWVCFLGGVKSAGKSRAWIAAIFSFQGGGTGTILPDTTGAHFAEALWRLFETY